jgi:hypothetical protein
MCRLVTELVDGLNNFLAADHPLREISEMRKCRPTKGPASGRQVLRLAITITISIFD